MLIPIVIVIVYFSILVYLGYKGYKQTKTTQDYMVAGGVSIRWSWLCRTERHS